MVRGPKLARVNAGRVSRALLAHPAIDLAPVTTAKPASAASVVTGVGSKFAGVNDPAGVI